MKGKFWLDTIAVFSESQTKRPADDSVKSMLEGVLKTFKGAFEDKDIEQESAQGETENADATEENVGSEQKNIEATEKIGGTTLHDLPGEEASADVTEEALGIAPESEGTAESLPIMAVWCQTVPSTPIDRRECGELLSRAAGGTR